MEHDLEILYNFLLSRNLYINFDKSKFIIFLMKNTNLEGLFDTLDCGGSCVERALSFNYLGLYIDSSLSWTDHIQHVFNKICPYVYVLSKLRKFVPKNVLTMLYFSQVQSHLSYLLPIWGGASGIHLDLLTKLQNKIVRIINNKPYSFRDVNSLYSVKILPLKQLIQFDSILLIKKILMGQMFSDVHLCSNISITNRNTRSGHLLRPPNYIMTTTQSSFIYRGIGLFNAIPGSITGGSSLIAVRKKLKEYVFSHELN